jgi:Mg-chelatase subunit ChlD
MTSNTDLHSERLRRWRLILGGNDADGTGCSLQGRDLAVDRALSALYDATAEDDSSQKDRRGSLARSAPHAARWLGDIRTYFPSSVVQVMQKDALERLGLKRMLLEPEMLQAVEPDVHLVATLLSLSNVIPEKTRDTARKVVRKVVEDLERRLESPLRQAIVGALNRSVRNRRPKFKEIDWHRTIRANMKHYQREYKTIIPEVRLGYGRKGQALKDVILCIDQSGSMATSVVYAGVLGAVMASIRAVRTSLVVFDTSVVDLTDKIDDPVDLLFSTQLGGGTDINQALSYCQSLIRVPNDTIFILISDLYEGGDQTEMIQRAASIAASGVNFITLLALDDRGAPSSDHEVAAAYANAGIPSFACTPDLFPDLMAAAIKRQDISQWASQNGLVTVRAE